MNLKEHPISSLSRTKKKDQSLKKLLVCLKNALKIFSMILLFSRATANDAGMVNMIPHSKYTMHAKRLLDFSDA